METPTPPSRTEHLILDLFAPTCCHAGPDKHWKTMRILVLPRAAYDVAAAKVL